MTESNDFSADSGRIPCDPPIEPAEQWLQLWEQGKPMELAAFLESTSTTAAQLSEVLQLDQHRRWERGEWIPAESYLNRFPQIHDDTESTIDLIFSEFRLRERLVESPASSEFRDRFPLFADVLSKQIGLHRAIQQDVPKPEVDDHYHSPEPVLQDRARMDWKKSDGLGLLSVRTDSSAHGIKALLRNRLKLLSIISCAAFVLAIPAIWIVLSGIWGFVLNCFIVVEAGLFAAILSSQRPISMFALRWIETALVASVLLFFGWEQVQFFQSGSFVSHSDHGWIGPIMTARSLSWSWAVAMIAYGMWIPNTLRRVAIAVAAMLIAFFAITLALAVTTESFSASAMVGFVLYSTNHIFVAAAIAIFGAYRIQTLQRAASDASKLGPYQMKRRIGAGGMGEVYLAEHALLRRPCALKVIRSEHTGNPKLLARFEREVQAMAALVHPNTVRIYDYGLADDGTFYYAMEYVPGLCLDELVQRHGALPPERVVFLLRQVCGALCEAHGVGLVHRDIKPGNILTCSSGGIYDFVKLLDFGLVRLLTSNSPPSDALTDIGSSAGTPAFMSPEQAAGTMDVDVTTDIYSLGAVAYFLLTGRPPFVEATNVQTMNAHITASVVPLSRYQPDIPADLERVVLRCLEKEPAQRFADIQALEDALANTTCAKDWSAADAGDWWCANAESDV